jgi:hypothetical protein
VIEIVEAMIGEDCILPSFEARSALPGGGMHSLHRAMPERNQHQRLRVPAAA